MSFRLDDLNQRMAAGPRDPIRIVLTPVKGAIASAAVLSLVVNVLMLASPLFMLQVYDRVLASQSLPTLVTLLLMVAGTFAFAAVLEILRMRLMARIAARFGETLGQSSFTSVIDQALTRSASEAQPLRDLEVVRQFLAGPGPNAFFDMPWVPIYLLLAYLLHPLLGLMTAVAACILFALTFWNEWVTKQAGREGSDHAQKALAIAEEARHGAEVLRVMGFEARVKDRWAHENQKALEQQVLYADRASLFSAGTRMLRLFLQSAVLALGAALAIEGQVSAGTIIVASIIMSRALAPVEQATAQWGLFQGTRRALGRLRATLGNFPNHSEPMPLPSPHGRIEVEGLVVAAPGHTQPLVAGVNFALEPGNALGVIGPSGSGKSTLVRALVGAWPVLAGSIRLDGAQIDHWPSAQFGAAVGYVPQDVELLSGTVTDNIARFDPEADPDAVVRAAQRANVHDMILRLPKGYMTELGKGGMKLSAGQRQRLALARALYGDPVVLVLDEPNSNLDSAGEAALAEALLDARRRGVTIVIVSHRPSSLQIVNQLLCLHEGRQAAFGPRDEILKSTRPTPVPANVRAFAGERAR